MTEFQMDGQMSMFDRDTWCGRMFPEQQVREQPKGQIFKESSPKSSASQNRMLPMFLCLKTENGTDPGVSTMRWEDGVWLGKFTMQDIGESHNAGDGLVCLPISTDSPQGTLYLTLNIGEKPREENRTTLSQILQSEVDPKYNLSAKACRGIINRARNKGNELPEELKAALEEQIRN